MNEWQCIVRSAAHCMKGSCSSISETTFITYGSVRGVPLSVVIHRHIVKRSNSLQHDILNNLNEHQRPCDVTFLYYLFGLQHLILCLKREYSATFPWFLRSSKTNAETVSSTMFRTLPYLSPGRGKRFIPSPQRPDLRWGPPSLLFNGYRRVLTPRLKRPGTWSWQLTSI